MDNQLTAQITAAIESGDFEGAEPLLISYFGSLEANLAQIPAMQDRAAALQEALGYMYRWLSLSRVLCSHIHEQLRLLILDVSYTSTANESFCTVDLRA